MGSEVRGMVGMLEIVEGEPDCGIPGVVLGRGLREREGSGVDERV